ncbi:MAG: hypothetical protein B6241_00040 [Spirochaetaceae bacterium 4572_59]|nr:MAG: hypothetical protein B6241_00040 [Spirochaetaceae bacterium 4572_59]
MAIFNLSILLILVIQLLADLFVLRKEELFPVLPEWLNDTEVLSEFLLGLYPRGFSSKTSVRMKLQWDSYRDVVLLGGAGGALNGRDRFQRGIYRLVSNDFILHDRFGLFRVEVKGETGRILKVQPGKIPETNGLRAMRMYQNSVNTSRSVLKDSSFYESRQYYPGDDPRRINWKLKALHGALFVKEGFFAAPAGKTVIILVNGQGGSFPVDQLIRKGSMLMEGLAERGYEIIFFASGMTDSRTLTRDEILIKRKELLTMIPPLPLKLPLSLNFRESASLYLFSCADSLPDGMLTLRGGETSLQKFLITDSQPGESYLKGGWHVIED